MSAALRLGRGGEFDRLRRIFARLGRTGQSLGDDCALIRVGRTWLAVSIDLSLEDVHFRTAWLSFADIGWRSVAAALSDLAADGAEPIGVVVSLGVPGKGRGRGKGEGDPAAEIMAGVGAAARRVGAHVLGGDLVRSDRYLVDVCVLGWTVRPVRRERWAARSWRCRRSRRVGARPPGCFVASRAPCRASPRDAGWPRSARGR